MQRRSRVGLLLGFGNIGGVDVIDGATLEVHDVVTGVIDTNGAKVPNNMKRTSAVVMPTSDRSVSTAASSK